MDEGVTADPRNAFAGRRDAPFRLFVAAVVLLGGAVLVLAVQALDLSAVTDLTPAVLLVCGLLLFGEFRPVMTERATDGLVVSTAFVFALLLHVGAPFAIVVQALVTVVTDLSRRKAPWRALFNAGQYSLSWGAAGVVVQLGGSSASLTSPLSLTAADLLGAAAGGVTYFVVNQLLVTRAVSLKTGEPMRVLIVDDLGHEALTNGALLALAPLVVLAIEQGVAFVPLLVPPLAAVYAVASVARTREEQALTDVLTGLPNRQLLALRAAGALRDAGEENVALLLFDLDRFKEVNDTLGHHVGDRLLQVVGQRLRTAVRPGDTVARLGGDEFALLVPAVTDRDEAVATAARLRDLLAAPIVLEGLLVDVGASVGVAVSPADGTHLDDLLQHADVAMYLAKESGGGVEAYDVARDRNSTGRLAMLGELRRAIATGQLELHFQPKAELATGHVVGVEALVRWRHPERGLVPPDEFVPLAERSGLMQPLTSWVLDAAVGQLAAWRAEGLELRMAVNVSVKDLSGDVLADHVAACLASHAVPAGQLQLEVTEGSLLAEPVRAEATLRRLAELGVTLSLDDFGTGYSSLGHLRRLPVREIKIDRTFVQRLDTDPRDLAIVRSVIDLAGGLGMTVVAEGVETELVWRRLVALGCDLAQGWHLSRAEPAAVLTPWLHARAAAEALTAR